MGKVSVAINSTAPTGQKIQKTLTDIIPSATSQQITNLTRSLNGLTTNVYNETNRYERINADTEQVGGVFAMLTVGTVSSTEEGAMWLEEDVSKP